MNSPAKTSGIKNLYIIAIAVIFSASAIAQSKNKVKNANEILGKELTRVAKSKHVKGAVIRVESGDGNINWAGVAGNMGETNTQFFIASTTKLFVSALILKLHYEGKIHIDKPIIRLFEQGELAGIHVYKGTDYSGEITMRHLLAHTSGLPDYFSQKDANGKTLEKELLAGNDNEWRFADVMKQVSSMKPKFEPGKPGKAFYSDTNYQILGKILEKIYGQELQEVLRQEIFEPLELENTYLYNYNENNSPQPFYYKNTPLELPRAMSSFGPDGGIVSNADDLMVFLKAYFNGYFFPKEKLAELSDYNRIFFPLHNGVGFMRMKTPWYFSPFAKVPEMLGHSGLSGAFAFYIPEKDIYMVGTVNQVAKPGTSFRWLIRMAPKL